MRFMISFQLLLLFSTSCVLGLHTPVARITRRLYSLDMKASIPILSPDSVVGGIKSTVNSINIAPITKLVLSHSYNYSISSLFTHCLKISLNFLHFLHFYSFFPDLIICLYVLFNVGIINKSNSSVPGNICINIYW